MFDYLGVATVVALAALFGWLSVRAWRSPRRVVKWVGSSLAGLLTLACTAILVAALVGYAKLNRSYDNPVSSVSVAVTPESIARGERFVGLCAECHAESEGSPLTGNDFLGEDAPPIGVFYAPNLTPTHLGDWSDGEIIRAIREGVHKDGRSLLIMPSGAFWHLSDGDVEGIVAYLRSRPRLEPDTPPAHLNILGAIMANVAPIFEAQPPITDPVVAPPPGASPEYGAYLVSYACTTCHGNELEGVPQFGAPTLIGAGAGWSEGQFVSFMRTGVTPGGIEVDGEQMPWEVLSGMFAADDDLRAIFRHLQRRFSAEGS